VGKFREVAGDRTVPLSRYLLESPAKGSREALPDYFHPLDTPPKNPFIILITACLLARLWS
jgi:hypothetical protein